MWLGRWPAAYFVAAPVAVYSAAFNVAIFSMVLLLINVEYAGCNATTFFLFARVCFRVWADAVYPCNEPKP